MIEYAGGQGEEGERWRRKEEVEKARENLIEYIWRAEEGK